MDERLAAIGDRTDEARSPPIAVGAVLRCWPSLAILWLAPRRRDRCRAGRRARRRAALPRLPGPLGGRVADRLRPRRSAARSPSSWPRARPTTTCARTSSTATGNGSSWRRPRRWPGSCRSPRSLWAWRVLAAWLVRRRPPPRRRSRSTTRRAAGCTRRPRPSMPEPIASPGRPPRRRRCRARAAATLGTRRSPRTSNGTPPQSVIGSRWRRCATSRPTGAPARSTSAATPSSWPRPRRDAAITRAELDRTSAPPGNRPSRTRLAGAPAAFAAAAGGSHPARRLMAAGFGHRQRDGRQRGPRRGTGGRGGPPGPRSTACWTRSAPIPRTRTPCQTLPTRTSPARRATSSPGRRPRSRC